MFILCKLIGKQQDIDRISIESVTVKKQEQKIDLWVEIDLKIDNVKESHAILIEDKYYGQLRKNQLEEYKPKFDGYYSKTEYKLHYALITCLYKVNPNYKVLEESAKKNDFQIYNLYELADSSLNYKDSESDIYNELFLREWL
jgi:hypothetical protein